MNRERKNMEENLQEPEGDDEGAFKLDYKTMKSEEIADDLYLTKYFLETSKGHKKFFDWLMWLDTDTLIYIVQCSNCLAGEIGEFSICEKTDSEAMAQDFSVFAVVAYNKEFAKKDVENDDALWVYNIVANSAKVMLQIIQGNIKIVDYADGSVFKDNMKFGSTEFEKEIEKKEKNND